MYNLHIYNREIEKLHVNTYEWKYINIVNSCNFFLSEFEEMKSCIYRVETANAGIWTVVALASSIQIAAWGNCTFHDQETLQNTIFDESLVCYHYPMQCSPCILLGCVFIMAKVSLSRVGTKSEGREPRYRYLCSGIRLNICWKETLSFLDVFSNNTQLVNCNWRHSFSQYNEFSNVF